MKLSFATHRLAVLPVAACLLGYTASALPIEAPSPGIWVDVTPPEVSLNFNDFGGQNYGTQTIGLSPANPLVVYFGTCYQGIWKTTDGGNNWVKVNTGVNGENLDTGRNWTLAVDPIDPNTVYTVAGYGFAQGLWKSTNGGADWAEVLPDSILDSLSADVYSIQIDPRDHLHLLVAFHGGWSGGADAGIVESQDGGSSWTIHSPVTGWGAGHYALFVDSATWMLATQSAGFWRTTDSGRTWSKVSDENIQHGGEQLYSTRDGTLYIGAAKQALRSTDRGASWQAVQGLPSTPDGYNAVIGDGTMLYAQPANTGSSTGGPYSFYASAEADGTYWSPYNAQTFSDGPMSMAVDHLNGVIYASSWDAGVWRLVTGY